MSASAQGVKGLTGCSLCTASRTPNSILDSKKVSETAKKTIPISLSRKTNGDEYFRHMSKSFLQTSILTVVVSTLVYFILRHFYPKQSNDKPGDLSTNLRISFGIGCAVFFLSLFFFERKNVLVIEEGNVRIVSGLLTQTITKRS